MPVYDYDHNSGNASVPAAPSPSAALTGHLLLRRLRAGYDLAGDAGCRPRRLPAAPTAVITNAGGRSTSSSVPTATCTSPLATERSVVSATQGFGPPPYDVHNDDFSTSTTSASLAGACAEAPTFNCTAAALDILLADVGEIKRPRHPRRRSSPSSGGAGRARRRPRRLVAQRAGLAPQGDQRADGVPDCSVAHAAEADRQDHAPRRSRRRPTGSRRCERSDGRSDDVAAGSFRRRDVSCQCRGHYPDASDNCEGRASPRCNCDSFW